MLSPNLITLIEEQQREHENEPLFMAGEQLKEIAEREPLSAELLEKDLAIDGMKLSDAAAALQKYADENHGKAKCFCITPKVAEGILRNFYSLPEAGAKADAQPEPESTRIDLASFL
ncbi:MAG: hypothetical protein IJZ89_03315 [Clostridia bacterium]|nr:hypothetical protein [Clostridia bacterium]